MLYDWIVHPGQVNEVINIYAEFSFESIHHSLDHGQL